MTARVEAVVIGAGVVGLAVARALALAGREVVVLEKHTTIGAETSARNSEVIHAGIYYPAGSLKAHLCVRGKRQLYEYCTARSVAHRRCGKIIVAASEAQHAGLETLRAQAAENGVDDLRWLDAAALRRLEPEVRGTAGLLSPSTGIIDGHALMLALQGDLESAGGGIALVSAFECGAVGPDGMRLSIVSDSERTDLHAAIVVNAAGLDATAVAAALDGFPPEQVPACHYAKGSYFLLHGRSPFERLVYPLPDPGGLGIHATLDLGSRVRFGPDVEWVDAVDYSVDACRATAFETAIRSYWPALPDAALSPAYAGVRPKLVLPGRPAADFMIQGPAEHGIHGLVNLFGIESPGLTSALAIGEHVAALLRHG